MSIPTKKDWSANQYLKFSNERTRPVYDLVSQVTAHLAPTSTAPRIFDLGCGPGNSTKVLLDAFPGAKITGMDSSADMLAKARSDAELAGVEFVAGDLATFEVGNGEGAAAVDLVFSNAVFHWLRHQHRVPTLVRTFSALKPGGVMAIQVPDNYDAPSHRLMRETALLPDKPWTKVFAATRIGELESTTRPDLDPIEPPAAFYNALYPHASVVNIWRTEYQHVLPNAKAIVEWVKGTGLQPYLEYLEEGEAKEEFLVAYENALKTEYEQLGDGKVMLGYPRLFVLAVRK